MVYLDRYVRDDLREKPITSDFPTLIVRFKSDASKYFEPEALIFDAKAEQANSKGGLIKQLGNPVEIRPVITTERLPTWYRKAWKEAITKSENDPKNRNRLVGGKPIEMAPPNVKEKDFDGILHEFVRLTYNTDLEADAALLTLSRDNQVLSVYRDSLFSPSQAVEPLYSAFNTFGSASSPKSGLAGQWGPRALNMQALWNITPGHGNVAILDTGTAIGHPDLAASLRDHRSFSFDAEWSNQFASYAPYYSAPILLDEAYQNPAPSNYLGFGHGTHIHGIIAAAHNGTGVRGQCAKCNVQIGKITSGSNSLNFSFTDGAQLANALRRMVRSGANVINMSLGQDLPEGASELTCGGEIAPTLNANNGVLYDGGGATGDGDNAFCAALRYATQWDVAIVAASGNHKRTRLQFPASEKRVIAVAGAQLGLYGASKPTLWNAEMAKEGSPARLNHPNLNRAAVNPPDPLERGSNTGQNQWVAAPARDIVSTMYPNAAWQPLIRCGTQSVFDAPSGYPWPSLVGEPTLTAPGVSAALNPSLNYGSCTGTSMAAPMISGMLGLMRSFVPLMNARSYQFDLMTGNTVGYVNLNQQNGDMRGVLRQSARIPTATGYLAANAWNTAWGFGFPNASAIATALSNRAASLASSNEYTSALIAMESVNQDDYFFTTSPTQAAAALHGSLLWPRAESQPYCSLYGAIVTGYRNPRGFQSLPSHIYQGLITGGPGLVSGGPWTPPPLTSCDNSTGLDWVKKIGSVYTSPRDLAGTALLGLRRYSLLLPGGLNGLMLGRHYYLADLPSTPVGTGVYAPAGWKFDGIEGYVYPPNEAAPNLGMTRLWLLQKPGNVYRLATDSNVNTLIAPSGPYALIQGTGTGGFWGWIFTN